MYFSAYGRRSFLSLSLLVTIAVAVTAIAPVAASAAAPQVRTQGPGFYRMVLGDFEITALLDGTHPFPIEKVMTNISKEEIASDLSRENLTVPVQGSINAFLVNTGQELILIDTGAGTLYGDCCGHLLRNLRAAGYQPEQVDEVYLTHLHKDHVGGIILNGKAVFANAVLRVSDADANYWLTASNKSAAPEFLSTFFDSAIASVAPYVQEKRFKTFAANEKLVPGITPIATPGHTPGHTSYLIESKNNKLLVWGDIVHVAPIQLQNPSASVTYDSSQLSALSNRRDLLDLAAQSRYIIGAAHIAFPGLGYIRANQNTYDWVPVNYEGDPGK